MQLRQQVLWLLFLQEVAAIKRAARDRRGRLGAPSRQHVPLGTDRPPTSPEHMERTLDLLARRVVGRVLLRSTPATARKSSHVEWITPGFENARWYSAITRGEIAPGVLFSPSITVRK